MTPNTQSLTLADTTVTDEFTIGAICLPTSDGDTRLMWDSRNKDEVAAAKAMFDDLKEKGFAFYTAEGKDGHRGEVIRAFDKKAERIIAIKALVGG